jgi:2,3-bisphosphoglycerate-independent phosphoglycerate mutase
LPIGEGENMLRRFVDDSINLLGSLELNRVRREEGLAPLNCLWPWGQGFRPDLPNLPLRRGDVVHVESGSFRLQGLCRLVGYAHGPRASFGTGLRTNFDQVRTTALSRRLSLTVIHSIAEMQRHHRTDETIYTLEELDDKVLVPLLERAAREPFELCLAAPAEGSGLVLRYSSEREERGSYPFDERALDDVRLSTLHLWEAVEPGFVGELERQ